MKDQTDFQNLRTGIERALSSCVGNIKLPGITDAALSKVKVSSERLRYVATRLEKDGHIQVQLSAEVELFLRISNTDVLSSVECAEFTQPHAIRTETPGPTPPPSGTVPQFGHVVLVVEENHSYSEMIGNSAMPYLNSLASLGHPVLRQHASVYWQLLHAHHRAACQQR